MTWRHDAPFFAFRNSDIRGHPSPHCLLPSLRVRRRRTKQSQPSNVPRSRAGEGSPCGMDFTYSRGKGEGERNALRSTQFAVLSSMLFLSTYYIVHMRILYKSRICLQNSASRLSCRGYLLCCESYALTKPSRPCSNSSLVCRLLICISPKPGSQRKCTF
jgi:hypothetical protein